jgi:hypothetical protein
MLKDGVFHSDVVHNHCLLLVKCSHPGALQTLYERIGKLHAVLPSTLNGRMRLCLHSGRIHPGKKLSEPTVHTINPEVLAKETEGKLVVCMPLLHTGQWKYGFTHT